MSDSIDLKTSIRRNKITKIFREIANLVLLFEHKHIGHLAKRHAQLHNVCLHHFMWQAADVNHSWRWICPSIKLDLQEWEKVSWGYKCICIFVGIVNWSDFITEDSRLMVNHVAMPLEEALY